MQTTSTPLKHEQQKQKTHKKLLSPVWEQTELVPQIVGVITQRLEQHSETHQNTDNRHRTETTSTRKDAHGTVGSGDRADRVGAADRGRVNASLEKHSGPHHTSLRQQAKPKTYRKLLGPV
jgi:hypothetical protein